MVAALKPVFCWFDVFLSAFHREASEPSSTKLLFLILSIHEMVYGTSNHYMYFINKMVGALLPVLVQC